MEQKKILWIFSILTAFLLIVFAVAWYFYSDKRKQNSATITKLEETQIAKPALASVDADAWAKNSESVPKPDENNPPTINIDNRVTVVNGDNEKDLDVTGLVENDKKVEGELPASISNTLVTKVVNKESPEKNTKTQAPVSTVSMQKKKKTSVKVTKPKAKTTVSKTTQKTSTKSSSSRTTFWVQTAALSSRLYAEEARARLQEKNFQAEIFTKNTSSGLVHRVRVGPFENMTEAKYWLSSVKKLEGFENSFVSEERSN
ncbi:MAG: SPOR domain-containing protein [Treponemataceae bacterium]